MRIPWRAKSAAYSVLEQVGDAPLYFVQKHVTKRSRIHVPEIKEAWNFHLQNLRDIKAHHVLEFGGGKSLIQNLLLSTLGLEQTVIDLNPMVDLEQVNDAIAALEKHDIPLRGPIESLGDLKLRYGITYIAPCDMRHSGLNYEHWDAIVSTNTLEHIPVDSIKDIWAEAARLLRPGGIISAKIDYSDHYAHTDSSISMLNYLKFSAREWRKYNHGNHYQNRLRHNHHVELIERAGFVIDRATALNSHPMLTDDFDETNLTGHPSDFCIDGYIVASKPEYSS